MSYRLVNKYTGNTSFTFNDELKFVRFLKINRTNEEIEGEFNLDDYIVEWFDAAEWTWREIL